MKKLVTLVFLLASLACSSYVSANKVDLQVRNVFFVTPADQLISNMNPGYYVNIQNNGPEDFQGSFAITYSYDDMGSQTPVTIYSGTIESGFYKSVRISSQESISWLKIDSQNEINETNEDNNNYYFKANDSQVRITSSWTGIVAENYYPTLCVLPNEFFFQQFSLQELNSKKLQDAEGSIIGFSFYSYAFQFPGSEEYVCEVQSRWPEGSYQNGILVGGKYSFQFDPLLDKYHSSCEWMANSSSAALDYWWLGDFYGVLKGMEIGTEAKIYVNSTIALRDLTRKSDGFTKTIKAIDRLRGDVNDDGVVDQADVDILSNVVSQGLYNPCMSFKNMYQEKGMNYGAGIVLFSTPDFLSNCLINIWINDKNDPLVQGLGIGELMSTTTPDTPTSPVYGVKNSFSVSGENVTINAPEADIYNVTAQTKEGKFFQVTGKIGETVKVPVDATNLRVETVRVKQNLTALTNPNKEISVSLYPNPITDHLNIKSMTAGNVRIINVSGQTIYAAPLASETGLRIDAKSWASGIYIINITSPSGKKSMKITK
jgi:hypothetical protein